jgi:hypothetical protein
MTARLVGYPKPHTYRSEKLRRAVASLPCVDCGKENETQAAHANQGKGLAIKASDAKLMGLCVRCHSKLDQGGIMTKEQRRHYEDEMIARTYVALMEQGKLEVAC